MMSKLQRKLRSRTGASMLLALVFLLFCSFIGSTVLVSATANAYRVAQVAEQQDFLNQRSAALLLGDELQLEPGQQFRLSVVDAYRTTKDVKVVNGGGVVDDDYSVTERVITFQLITNDTDVTEMQRLMLEATVWRFLRENPTDENKARETKVALIGFPGASDLDDFWFAYSGVSVTGNTVSVSSTNTTPIKGAMTVNGSASTVSMPSYTANFSSGKGTELYDFHVDFGDLSQLRLTMNAFSGTSDPITVNAPATEGVAPGDPTTGDADGDFIQVTTVSTQTSISWDDPKVEKGGAEA